MAEVIAYKTNKIGHDSCGLNTLQFSKIREEEFAVTQKQFHESFHGLYREEGLNVTNVLRKDLMRFRKSLDVWGLAEESV